MTKDMYDAERIYCRKLGHYLTFAYCRQESGETPCSRVHDCWFQRIPIEEYTNEFMSEAARSAISTQPKEKVASLLDLIRKAQEHMPHQ